MFLIRRSCRARQGAPKAILGMYSNVFFPEALTPVWCPERCDTKFLRALGLRSGGVEQKSALLYRNFVDFSFFALDLVTKCPLRCDISRALALRYGGAEEKSAVLYRCRISGDFHFSHQIWSPLTLYLLLSRLKI